MRQWSVVLKGVAFLVLVCVWHVYADVVTKVRCVLGAACYSLIEYTWYGVTVEQGDNVVFDPFSPNTRKPHTTFAQFWANILYNPILLYAYRQLLVDSWFARVALFPLNVWTLEVIEGYCLIFFYGRNVAWEYSGNDVYFHRNIKLAHWKLWLILGIVVEVAFYCQLL